MPGDEGTMFVQNFENPLPITQKNRILNLTTVKTSSFATFWFLFFPLSEVLTFNSSNLNLYFSLDMKGCVKSCVTCMKLFQYATLIAHTGFFSGCVPWEVQGCGFSWKWSGKDVCRWNMWHHQESTWWWTFYCCFYCRESSELWGSDHSSRQLLA